MRRLAPIALLALLSLPALAAGSAKLRRAVEDLFSPDPGVRATARETVRAAGAEALPLLLARIEEEQAPRDPSLDVLEMFDIRDLAGDAEESARIVARVRAAVGGDADVRTKEGGLLVVRASATVMYEIRDLLDRIRAGRDRLVTIEARFLRVPAGGAGVDDARPIAAPRLTCWNGQNANLVLSNRISCITDYEVTKTETGVLADPVIEGIHDGILLDVRPVVREDGESVTLHLRLRVSRLTRPIEVEERDYGGAAKVRVQLPEVREIAVRRTVTVAAGEEALVDAGGDQEGGRLFIRIAARPLDPDAVDPGGPRSGDEIELGPKKDD